MKNEELKLNDAKAKIIKIWGNSLDCLSRAERNLHILYRDLYRILLRNIFEGLEPGDIEIHELKKGKLVVRQKEHSITYECPDGKIVLSLNLFSKITNRIHFLCTFDELNEAIKMIGPLDEFIVDFETLKIMAESFSKGYSIPFALSCEQYANEEDLFQVKKYFVKLRYIYVQDQKAIIDYLVKENQHGELANTLIKRSQVLAYKIKKFEYLNLIEEIVKTVDFKERSKITYEGKGDFISFNFYRGDCENFDVENDLSHAGVKISYLVDYFINYNFEGQFSIQDLIYYYQLEYFYAKIFDIAHELMNNVTNQKKYEELSYHQSWAYYFEHAEHMINLEG